jgi:NDP-sugar pyrophosphorylase family protein
LKKQIQLIIPAAGIGSRFRDVGISTPKPLIEVGGIPMLLWVIANFELGPSDRVIVISQRVDSVKSNLSRFLEQVKFSIDFLEIEGITSGPAATVKMALNKLDPQVPIIVANSDQYISNGISAFTDLVRTSPHAGSILTMGASGNKWSYIGRDLNGKINKVVEKQEISSEATVGIYAWADSQVLGNSLDHLFNHGEKVNNEYYVAPSYEYLIINSMELESFSVGPHGECVHGLGTPEDLAHFIGNPSFSLYSRKIHEYYGI